MLKKLGLFILTLTAVLGLISCDNSTQTSNANAGHSTNTNLATTSANATNTVANTVTTNSNVASLNSNTVSVGEVTRIAFAKGATSGTTNVMLAPNATKQFAVEAAYGQKIKVTAGSKEAFVKMISGTDRQVESAGGGLVVEVNTKGDVIFEVRNSTSQELKTTVRAEITSSY